MNKVTRICVFVLLICLVLWIVGSLIYSAKTVKYYNDQQEKYDDLGLEYNADEALMQEYLKIFIFSVVIITNVTIILCNLKWFFSIDQNYKDIRKNKKIEKMQEKLNNLKGDE